MTRQSVHRLLLSLLVFAGALALSGCSSSGGTLPQTTVGVGVQLSASGSTALLPGGTVVIGATVLNDVNGQGVRWTISPATGAGVLSLATTSAVVYTAPASLGTSAISATITATSIANSAYTSNITVTTAGPPQLIAQSNLPANQHVGYGTSISASGGVAPYAWKVVSGQLPPGLALNGSSGATLGISGTPTALGTWTFTVQVTDANSHVAQGSYTIQVNPQASCLLQGTFSYLLHGFTKTGGPATRAGVFTVNANGVVTGLQDVKSDLGTTIGEAVTSGQCQNQVGNHGTITFVAASGTLVFDWAILGSLNEGFMQETDGSGVAGTASFVRQDPSVTSVASLGTSTTAGAGVNYAFGVFGTDSSLERLGYVGRLTLNAQGSVSNGKVDANGSAGLSDAALTGTLSAPDANGRGVLSLAAGGKPLVFEYYAVSGDSGRKLLLIENETTSTSPIVAGELTVQGALQSSSFGSAATPSVMELWSAVGTHYPTTTTWLGQFYGSAPSAGGALAPISLTLDAATGGASSGAVPYAASYALDPSTGRVTLSFGTGTAARTFAGYLNAPSNGYLVETTANATYGGYGLLEAQTGVPFNNFVGGSYLGTTVLPGTISPISLLPAVTVQSGAIGGSLSGQYALDAASGRGQAQITRDLFGGSGLIFYLINDQKIVVMGNGANAINTQIGWWFF